MKTNFAGTVTVTLILVSLCFFVGWTAWGPNMDAEYTGTGMLGVLMPVMAVVASFIFGIGTGLSMEAPDETDSSRRISL